MNPIIRHKGVCDPHIHIFEGKAYLYATHDNYRPQSNSFQMTQWGIWSSTDLIQWTCERILLPEDFYCGKMDQCWAVDAAEKDGRYYWYYSVGADCVGVGVADSPAGPFREALGHALVGPDTPPVNVHKWDPCVFRDDDGTFYLICGSCIQGYEYQIARLGLDMCSLAEPLRAIPYSGNPSFEDKATVHKANGRYYLSHASFYGVSDSVYGPYTYCGSTRANIDHNSFFTYHGQTYQASGGMDTPIQYFRASFLTYCHYRRNGEIAVDVRPTVYGVGQYDAGWPRIEAEWFFDCRGAAKEERGDGGFQMALSGEGSWLCFPHVCHMTAGMTLRVGYSAEESAALEIRESAPDGALLGVVPLAAGGDATACAALPCQGAAAGLGVALKRQGDGIALPMDAGAGGTVRCELRYAAEEAARLRVRCGGREGAALALPATDGRVRPFAFALELEPGVNEIALSLEAERAAGLVLDTLYTGPGQSIYRSYPAALGDFDPFGNGIWDGLPQREWNPEALGGCYVSVLKKAGCRVFLREIDGGQAGGRVRLELHYRNPNPAAVRCRVTANGTRSQTVELLPGDAMQKAGAVMWLRPGPNEVALTVEQDSERGVCLSAVSVVPDDREADGGR
ncbi:MAG TPA: family 43 glycosylhydrolase [Candidatus Gemmiger faecigallinarum]|nr:family 43 glycosylhydrolase [Candidatus Gemmiger faecigallinarum]